MAGFKVKFENERYSSEELARSIQEILEANRLLSMATVTKGKRSHINTAYYCYNSSLDLYILTYPNSNHSGNLVKNPSVAVAIFDSSQPWHSGKRGLQLFGTCRPARAHETVEALSLYARRFKGLRKWVRSISDIKKLDSRFYVIKIESLKLFDEPNFGEENFITIHKTID